MAKHQAKIIHEGFSWTPFDKGPGMMPRKPELRKPLLWLNIADQTDLYLVNLTDEILISVKTCSGGFETLDDQVLTIADDIGYEYSDVKPQWAVKIDEFDRFYDDDYIIQTTIFIESQKLGSLEIRTPPEKGGLSNDIVLLWDNGDIGKYVKIIKH